MQPKKYAIYTAMVGGYDEIMQPKVVDDRFDYILFSNDIKEDRVGVWQVRPISYFNDVQTKIARYVKTHPEELLSDYKVSVWIDASVVIESDYIYKRTKELDEKKQLIATHLHPDWVCAYEEMLGIMMLRWESEETTIRWGQYLRRENFPREIGTWETRVLYRMHSNNLVKNFDLIWWWCIENFSRRDQYSFQYVLWKLGLDCISFLPLECNVHNSEHFSIKGHVNYNNKNVASNSLMLNYYSKHADKQQEIENVYYWIYGRKNPFFWVRFLGILYRIKHSIECRLGVKPYYTIRLKSLKK